jgi:hypothetical protein
VLGFDFEQEVIDHAVDAPLPAASDKVRNDMPTSWSSCAGSSRNSPYINFDGLCCLDVIEHLRSGELPASSIDKMVRACLSGDGVAVIGTPSIAFGAVRFRAQPDRTYQSL